MDETWRKIPGFENYEVSNLGQVRRITATPYKTLKPWVNGGGYYYVSLYKNKMLKKKRVSILVAQAFCKKKDPDQSLVDHINRDIKNNHATNLRWVTPSENRKPTELSVVVVKAIIKLHSQGLSCEEIVAEMSK